MAVAVKNPPEVSPSLLDRMAAASLAGTVYVLGCIGIVFYLLPSLWWTALQQPSFGNEALLGLIMLAAAIGLAVLGVRLLGGKTVPGLRAGIFMGVVWFVVILLLARWASLWIEYWTYGGLFGANGPTVGPILSGVVALFFLFLGVRWFLKPGWERFLVRLEGQGWFSARAYKSQQGLRVRRGTIFGLLVLVGAGIWTLQSHGTLFRGPRSWSLNLPFTGRVEITNPGDAGPLLAERFPEGETPLKVDRFTFQEINAQLDPATHVKVDLTSPFAPRFEFGKIYPRSEFDEVANQLQANGETPPHGVNPVPAGGDVVYRTLTLLPSLPITVPLLLLALSLWLAWRIVNMPTFADFLIATEAELNKVSWTTQKRLVQDTVVVLVTTVLLTVFLFATDQTWRLILSWKPIGVLQIPEEDTKNTTNLEQRPW
jgi:preprotein translocase SecE subunit